MAGVCVLILSNFNMKIICERTKQDIKDLGGKIPLRWLIYKCESEYLDRSAKG